MAPKRALENGKKGAEKRLEILLGILLGIPKVAKNEGENTPLMPFLG